MKSVLKFISVFIVFKKNAFLFLLHRSEINNKNKLVKKLERLQTPRRRRLVNKLQAIEKKKLALDESDRRCAIMLNNTNELAVACFSHF